MIPNLVLLIMLIFSKLIAMKKKKIARVCLTLKNPGKGGRERTGLLFLLKRHLWMSIILLLQFLTCRSSEDENPNNEENTDESGSNELIQNMNKADYSGEEEGESVEEDKSKTPSLFSRGTVEDIITGLEITVEGRNFDDGPLVPKDYTYSYQFKIKLSKEQKKIRNHSLLKFKDFAPKVFHKIRSHFGIDSEDFLSSFEYENLVAKFGEGKSGAFFIFTKDRQYILKTASGDERDFLLQMLPSYYQHIHKYPDTLLPRFYGVYSMKHEGIGGVIRFVIMNNLFASPYKPVETYDLKGSKVGRKVSEKKLKPNAILKDIDIKKMKRKIWLPEDMREAFSRQLQVDSQFLARHKVMDYSLLLGVHYETPENIEQTETEIVKFEENNYGANIVKSIYMEDFGGIRGINEREENREELYFVGIIDILVQYVARKKFEHLVKSIPYSGNEVSVVHPNYYARRFFHFMDSLIPDDDDESSESLSDGFKVPGKRRSKYTVPVKVDDDGGDIYAERKKRRKKRKN
eukprot:TRINITY_DN9516_c0_g1_i2.p1 TRINITY_DN9516_c0_g1~~TRINITY_DN9516_c0_g1_i2.p1  ORF type:complete len:518 (+),score=124.39 TRINITY_DN9516_c0_g1_i2:236-1789(+)